MASENRLKDLAERIHFIGEGWSGLNQPPEREDGLPWWDIPESRFDADDEEHNQVNMSAIEDEPARTMEEVPFSQDTQALVPEQSTHLLRRMAESFWRFLKRTPEPKPVDMSQAKPEPQAINVTMPRPPMQSVKTVVRDDKGLIKEIVETEVPVAPAPVRTIKTVERNEQGAVAKIVETTEPLQESS